MGSGVLLETDIGRVFVSLLDDARRLLTLREELASEEARLADRRVDLARRYLRREAEDRRLEEDDE